MSKLNKILVTLTLSVAFLVTPFLVNQLQAEESLNKASNTELAWWHHRWWGGHHYRPYWYGNYYYYRPYYYWY